MGLLDKLKAKQTFGKIESDVRKINGVSTFYVNNVYANNGAYCTDFNLRCYAYGIQSLEEYFEGCKTRYKTDIKVEKQVQNGNEVLINGTLINS